MRQFQESKFRTWLAQKPATKLFIKSFIDLSKFEFFQFKLSASGWIETVKCHIYRYTNNKELVECNFCNWKGNQFYPHVTTAVVKLKEKCPICHSIPRYRTLMKFLIDDINLFSKKLKILEVGPNRSLQNILLDNSNFDYLSVDLKSPHAMLHMDVTDLKLDDEDYDFLLCIGVMHYVDDDLKGFREMYRVLKPNGQLIFASGIDEKSQTTVEYKKRIAANNFTIRTYGWDVKEKIETSGFKIKLFNPYEDATKKERTKYGLGAHSIFLLEKL
ncbi:MAG: class I SAM-dependent methyltransferase [Melioribacteraceae bacterium]